MDTVKRFVGPTTPQKAEAGSSLYAPSTNQKAAIKSALFTNYDPARGAWGYISLGAMSTRANRIVPGLYVPPNTVRKVDLDLILDGDASDALFCRQVVDMTFTTMTLNIPTNGSVSTTTDAATAATGSWAGVSGRPYILTVVNTHATDAPVPTSITDTHTGVTWTQVQTIQSADGAARVTQYRAQTSGSNSTTTTANFATNFTAAHVFVTEMVGGDVTGTHGSEAITAAGTRELAATGTALYIPGIEQCGARFAAFGINTAGTVTPGTGFTELFDAALATPNINVEGEYALTPGYDASALASTTGIDRLHALLNMQDSTDALVITLDGVLVT